MLDKKKKRSVWSEAANLLLDSEVISKCRDLSDDCVIIKSQPLKLISLSSGIKFHQSVLFMTKWLMIKTKPNKTMLCHFL